MLLYTVRVKVVLLTKKNGYLKMYHNLVIYTCDMFISLALSYFFI